MGSGVLGFPGGFGPAFWRLIVLAITDPDLTLTSPEDAQLQKWRDGSNASSSLGTLSLRHSKVKYRGVQQWKVHQLASRTIRLLPGL